MPANTRKWVHEIAQISAELDEIVGSLSNRRVQPWVIAEVIEQTLDDLDHLHQNLKSIVLDEPEGAT